MNRTLKIYRSKSGQKTPLFGSPKLTFAKFEQFVLPHLQREEEGESPGADFRVIFNYTLRLLHIEGAVFQ
jgi:hypothetical protein